MTSKTTDGKSVSAAAIASPPKSASSGSPKWYGQKPKKRGWSDAREEFVLGRCEHCGAECVERRIVGTNVYVTYVGAVDHVVPERLILQLAPGMDPHDRVNLMCLQRVCHGIKIGADRLLCRGDKLGFLQRLRENGWPMERVQKALEFYGM